MQNDAIENIFPRANDSTLLMVVAVVFGLLVVAVLIELYRRYRERQKHMQREWHAADEIFREKQLTPNEQTLLQQLIKQHMPHSPVRAVTLRQSFNGLVDFELEKLQRTGKSDQFDEMGVVLRDIRIRLGLDILPFGQRIQTTRDLRAHLSIWIAKHDAGPTDWHHMYVVSVDEAHIHLGSKNPDTLPSFGSGDEIRCRMWREEDARYVFSTTINTSITSPPILVLAHSTELKRMQSRAHFRIRYEESAFIDILNAPRDSNYDDVLERPPVTRLRGRFASLSGGGFSVILSQPVPKQVLLRTALILPPKTEPVEVIAQLVSAQPLNGDQSLIRATFVSVDDDVRDAISRYAFHAQQHQLMLDEESNDA